MTDPADRLVADLTKALDAQDRAEELAKHIDTPITPAQARAAMGLDPIPDNSWQPEEDDDGGGLRDD